MAFHPLFAGELLCRRSAQDVVGYAVHDPVHNVGHHPASLRRRLLNRLALALHRLILSIDGKDTDFKTGKRRKKKQLSYQNTPNRARYLYHRLEENTSKIFRSGSGISPITWSLAWITTARWAWNSSVSTPGISAPPRKDGKGDTGIINKFQQ